MPRRWRVVVELTFDVDPEDTMVKYHGDAEVDFSQRAFERVRPSLNKVIEPNRFAHYTVLEMPKICFDL